MMPIEQRLKSLHKTCYAHIMYKIVQPLTMELATGNLSFSNIFTTCMICSLSMGNCCSSLSYNEFS